MNTDYRIEIDLLPNCSECQKYHYVIMAWYEPEDKTKNGFWHNTGLCGIEDTPEDCFKIGYQKFLEYYTK